MTLHQKLDELHYAEDMFGLNLLILVLCHSGTYHIIDESDAELAIVDVWGQQGGAGPVSLGAIGAEGRQPFLDKLLEGNEGALASRRPLQ